MPARQTRNAKPASGPQLLRVDDMSSGLELRLSPSLLKPNQSRLLRNWTLAQPGALVTYPGWVTISTSSLGARRLQGGQRIYLDGVTPFTIAADNGNLYHPTDAGVWGAAVLTGRHATNQHYFPYDRDFVADFDGSNMPKKSTNGTTWTGMGIAAPTVAPTASAQGGGSLIDGHTYELSYSYQDDDATLAGPDSNESATVQQAVSGGSLTARISVTASADTQVDSLNVFVRDVTAGETLRRFYANYPNTTTTHDVTSNTWSANRVAPTDHTVPVVGLVGAIVWKNRWWAWIGNRLYFTQIFENQSWPALFYIDMPFERGDNIAACSAQGDTLIVFGQVSKPFVILGQTSLDFEVRPALGAQAGAFGPRAVATIENGIVHATAEGVYIFDGASDRLLSYNIDPGWTDLVQHASASDLAQIAVIYHGLRKELRIGTPRLFPWGTAGEWILDLNRTRAQVTPMGLLAPSVPAWTSTDRPIGGYILWDGNEPTLGNRGRLFSWSLTAAKLYEEATGTTADGGDLVADYEGATHAFDGYIAQFLEAYTEFQPSAGLFAMTPLVDSVSKGSITLNIGASQAVYGTATYGTSTYGGAGRTLTPFMLPLSCEGRQLAFRARYTGKVQFIWYTYEVLVMPEPALQGIA